MLPDGICCPENDAPNPNPSWFFLWRSLELTLGSHYSGLVQTKILKKKPARVLEALENLCSPCVRRADLVWSRGLGINPTVSSRCRSISLAFPIATSFPLREISEEVWGSPGLGCGACQLIGFSRVIFVGTYSCVYAKARGWVKFLRGNWESIPSPSCRNARCGVVVEEVVVWPR